MTRADRQIGSPRRGGSRKRVRRGLVVIAIIGLIMSLVGPRVLNYLGESKIKAARIQIQSSGERSPYEIVPHGSDGEGGSVAPDVFD